VLGGQVTYTLEAKLTTLTRADDRDGDRVPDLADDCDRDRGPTVGAGCPDSDRDLTFDRDDRCPHQAGTGPDGCRAPGDERVVVLVDGRRVDTQSVLTQHGGYRFALAGEVGKGRHVVKVVWYDGAKVVEALTRRIG